MNKFPRKYLNSKEEGFYIMLEAALAYISGGTEETALELTNHKTVELPAPLEHPGRLASYYETR